MICEYPEETALPRLHPPNGHEVRGTDGGWGPKSARRPLVTTDTAAGQMRTFEFDALAGDWAIHGHKSHHTMNAIGDDVPTIRRQRVVWQRHLHLGHVVHAALAHDPT